MNTDEAIKQIKPYIIGDLPPKEASILEGHIDVSPVAEWYHQRYYRQLLPVMELPSSEPSEGVLSNLFEQAKQEIAEDKLVPPARVQLLRGMGAYWKYAAAILLAFGITAAIVLSSPTASNPDKATGAGVVAMFDARGEVSSTSLQLGKRIDVPQSRSSVITLRDGTRVQATGGTSFAVYYDTEDLESKTPEGEANAKPRVKRFAQIDLYNGEVLVEMDQSARKQARKADLLNEVVVRGGDASLTLSPFTGLELPADFAPLATVSYEAPVEVVVGRASGALDVELRRQPVWRVLDVASNLGLTINYDDEVQQQLENSQSYVSLVKKGLTRDNFAQELNAQCGIELASAGKGEYSLSAAGIPGGTGEHTHTEYFNVSVLAGKSLVVGLDGQEYGAEVFPTTAILDKTMRTMLSAQPMFTFSVNTYVAGGATGASMPQRNALQVENNVVGRFMSMSSLSHSKSASNALVRRMNLRNDVNQAINMTSANTLQVRKVSSRDSGLWVDTGSGMRVIPFNEPVTIGGVSGTLVYWNDKGAVLRDASGTCHHVSFTKAEESDEG